LYLSGFMSRVSASQSLERKTSSRASDAGFEPSLSSITSAPGPKNFLLNMSTPSNGDKLMLGFIRTEIFVNPAARSSAAMLPAARWASASGSNSNITFTLANLRKLSISALTFSLFKRMTLGARDFSRSTRVRRSLSNFDSAFEYLSIASIARSRAFCAFCSADSASTLALSASERAVSADVFASPACLSASNIFPTSYLWTFPLASSSLAVYLHSPTNPRTTNISPIPAQTFAHVGSSSSGFENFISGSTDEISLSFLRIAPTVFSWRCRLHNNLTVQKVSGPSNATPAATTTSDQSTRLENWLTAASKHSLTGSAFMTDESASARLDRRLIVVAICGFIFNAICVLELTIGIKKVIIRLFSSKL